VPEPAAARRPSSGSRFALIAWRAGWVALALVSMAVTYVVLVVAGR
jgi:hypothetical protein